MKFAFKVPEEITCKTFPATSALRTDDRECRTRIPFAGDVRRSFLAAAREPIMIAIAVLIFEFGTFSKKNYPAASGFFHATSIDF